MTSRGPLAFLGRQTDQPTATQLDQHEVVEHEIGAQPAGRSRASGQVAEYRHQPAAMLGEHPAAVTTGQHRPADTALRESD
ncbi:hypothetical protein FHS23_004224 [Prauserella isguenensis]|uniref:Uncharacterized protein n=1 Tax=Prauserella isguenensis TaxID=1470180 RepID=A0A839S4Z8_9PSEU|nr:hypothetical protein [Prauserella isguenensis]MBB3053181.1 hypothetical protein [Prauserella isguenensis]